MEEEDYEEGQFIIYKLAEFIIPSPWVSNSKMKISCGNWKCFEIRDLIVSGNIIIKFYKKDEDKYILLSEDTIKNNVERIFLNKKIKKYTNGYKKCIEYDITNIEFTMPKLPKIVCNVDALKKYNNNINIYINLKKRDTYINGIDLGNLLKDEYAEAPEGLIYDTMQELFNKINDYEK